MLAVGYQAVVDSAGNCQPTHLLCLDPGSESPKTSLWNAVVEVFDEDGNAVQGGPLTSNHWGPDGWQTKCHLQDAVILSA